MKPSREGKRFILSIFLIAVAALNTGNNLIYLIFSMMLSIFILSVIILMINMNGLVLEVSQSQPLFANSRGSLDITLSNRKKKIPSYSIKVRMSDENMREAYFAEVPHVSSVSDPVPVVYKKRGMYGYGDFFIESSFPFVFFSKKILSKITGGVIVYPEIGVSDKIISEMIREGYEKPASSTRKADEFAMIREFRYGDDWRKIHWKASAKTAKTMVMEYAVDEPRKLTIILDNLMPSDPESFEKAVSMAASISDRFLKEGFFVRLITCRKVIPFGSGREHLFKILDILAVIEGQNSWECPLSAETEPEGLTVLLLNSEHSPLKKFISVSNTVIYAATL